MRKGKLYRVKFYDHCIGMDRDMVCEVVGWCIKNEKNYFVLSHWMVRDKDKDIVDNNYEYTTLIKSTVIESIEL